jgi:hypothetical protein
VEYLVNDLYDTDVVLWSERQTELLRRRATGDLANDADLDWDHIAEEIAAVGRSARRELQSRLVRLLQHLLKWRYQPEFRSVSWRTTIRNQRHAIEDLLVESPSLKAALPELFLIAYPRARLNALDETGLLDLPATTPFTVEQALGDTLPD